jgi:hypothetical protein
LDANGSVFVTSSHAGYHLHGEPPVTFRPLLDFSFSFSPEEIKRESTVMIKRLQSEHVRQDPLFPNL